jgi:flagellin-like hook-associated protein FlgL
MRGAGMLIVQHNLAAINAQRQFNIVSNQKMKSMRKLASGYRINSAADDAAGLAISEKMRRQIRGLKQGTENLQDGVSLCQVADGALNEVEDMLQRMNELSVKAANGTNEETDRGYIDTEVQQLKEETNRILGTTSFNEKYIFRQPYYPTVTGTPDDFQVYNSGSGTYAGIIVGNTRYSWNEIGMNYNPDGTFADNDVTFTHKNELTGRSEKVHLTTEKGAALNDIHRVYDWSADTTGIYINGAMAEKWTDLGITGDSISGGSEYSFTYHGMKISFTTEDGDSLLSDAINGINGDGMSAVSWQTTSPYTNLQAVITYGTITLPTPTDITDQTYAEVVRSHKETPYRLEATATGISVYNIDSKAIIGSETAWSALATDASDPSYRINDWGTSGENTNASTLDHDEVYTYTGKLDTEKNGTKETFSLNFQIMDEASRAAAIASLNTFTLSQSISAPLTAKLSDGGSASVDFDYDFQYDSGRNFTVDKDVNGNALQCYNDIAIGSDMVKTTEGGVTTYKVSEVTCTIGDKKFTSDGLDGNKVYSEGATKLEGLQLKYTNSDGTKETITLESYDFTKSLDLKIYANGYAKRSLIATASSGPENATFYNIEMNSVNKSLKLQASANEEDRYNLVWKAMNTTILGIAAADTKTGASAANTINLVKKALNEVSSERSLFGSWQNRIEHGMNQNRNVEENTQAAESAVRDTDMAKETVRLSNQQILEQAGYSVMAQANQSRQGVLTILQSV